MPRFCFLAMTLLTATLLVACGTTRPHPRASSVEALAAQELRESALAARTHWTLQARIAISGENGGSGDLTWRQDGSVYVFSVRAPNGKTLKLSGDEGRVVLEGVDPQPDVGTDPERLLHDRLGAEVPFAALHAWALGMRLPGTPAQLQFDERNLPALLEQGGWTVEYLDWFADRSPPLPKKVFASKAKDKVKLIIQSWTFDEQPQ